MSARYTTFRVAAVVLGAAITAAAAAACRSTPASAPAASADTWAVVDGHEIKRDDVDKAFRRITQTPPRRSRTRKRCSPS